MHFFLNYTPSSTDKRFHLKELTFKQLRVLNKFLKNKDDNSIDLFFENILSENIIDYNKYSFNILDKFNALLLLRIASISSEVEVKNKLFTKKTDLIPFYSKVSSKKSEATTIDCNDIKLTLSLPKRLHFENIFSCFCDCIDGIIIKNQDCIDFNCLQLHEKQKIFDELPAFVTEKIHTYKQDIETNFSDIVLNFDNETDIKISPFNTSFFEVLKALFYVDLKSIYDIQYLIVSKLNYSAEYLEQNTLLENIILLNNFSDEMNKMTAESKKTLDDKNTVHK
jgi:hypothetical protein